MELRIHIDPEQMDDMVKTSLIEYHDYLAKNTWSVDDDVRIKIRDAFVIVLEQYMSPTEYEKYMAKFIN
jgi:hypothetical protein